MTLKLAAPVFPRGNDIELPHSGRSRKIVLRREYLNAKSSLNYDSELAQ